MMRLKLISFGFVLLLASNLYAQQNPCANPNQVQSVVVNISTAVTTRLIQNSSLDRGILVCGFTLTLSGAATANTVKFQYSTNTAACASGTTDLSGPLTGPPATTTNYSVTSHPLPFQKLPVASDFCVVTSQAVVVAGVVSYTIP